MSGREEDPYSQIFSILKHPTRRLILRSLAKGSGERFSQLQSELKVDSPSLSYHLDALGRLVEKKDEFYFPTELGKAALSMMKNVEEPPEHKMIPVPQDTARTILTWLMLLLLLGFGTLPPVVLRGNALQPSLRGMDIIRCPSAVQYAKDRSASKRVYHLFSR